MRVIMPDIIDRAGRNFNADETDGVSGRDSLIGTDVGALRNHSTASGSPTREEHA
jgi:hypothetical protein